jgi:hypothetical protein
VTDADSSDGAAVDPLASLGVPARATLGLVTLALVLVAGIGFPLFSVVTNPSHPVPVAGWADPSSGSAVGVDPVPTPAPGGGSASAGPSASASPSASRSVSAKPSSARPSASRSASTGPVPAKLTAQLSGAARPVGGYDGQVTISNPGEVTVSGWTVTISLSDSGPGKPKVTASGASVRQGGSSVTFTPTGDTATIAAHGSVQFSFSVEAVVGGQPTGCSIDGRSCG